jgi:glucose dehydrogenase
MQRQPLATVLKAQLLKLSIAAMALAGAAAQAQQGAVDGGWDAYGADTGSTKYTGLDQINAANVNDLEIVWRRPALDQYYFDLNPQQRFSSTWNAAPLVKNGVAYITNGVGLVEAFDPGTGTTLWVQEPVGGAEGIAGAPTRGAAYWSDADDERIFVQRGTYLYALNASTGATYPDFGVDGRADLQLMPAEFERFRWGGVPMVVGDVVIIGQSMSDNFDAKEAYRRAALDLQYHSPAGPVWHRHLAGPILVLHRSFPGLGSVQCRPGIGPGLYAHLLLHQRYVWRPSHRR